MDRGTLITTIYPRYLISYIYTCLGIYTIVLVPPDAFSRSDFFGVLEAVSDSDSSAYE